ncbi:hypothetical protein BKA64DRAFT_741275 [Cadophora sp. MPI-SDFR-AT-0126]|nr:hypothetical protein BKA64DRAFT_741275 [Leotiomycetes sp. MPI-SDFR-AT-0126]
MMIPYITLLSTLLAASTDLVLAQQPTPYIPATHTGYSISTPTNAINTVSLPSPFLPPLPPTFRLSNSKEEYAASIYLALTSVQSTWTAGPEYPRITAAVYAAAPSTIHPSLLISGYNWPAIVSSPWYDNVDASVRSQITAQEAALQSMFDMMVEQVDAVAKVESEAEDEDEGKAKDGGMESSAGLGRRGMLMLGRDDGKGCAWALGMGMGMGFVVGVWLVGAF